MIPLSSHWSASIPVLAVYALVAGAHLLGLRRMAASNVPASAAQSASAAPPVSAKPPASSATQPTLTARSRLPEYRVREALAFHGGLLAALLALVSPVGYWAHHVIWVRSVQDLLLANVAPGLLVLGAPWHVLRDTLTRHAAPRAAPAVMAPVVGPPAAGLADAGLAAAAPAARRSEPRAQRWSLAVVAVFAVVWCGWHLPLFYDAALGHPVVYAAEVISYLGLGVLFWLQLIGSRPLSPSLPPLHRVMVLTGTVTVSTILAMVLVFGSRVVYHGYVSSPHHTLSVLADQQVGGGVLWVLMLPSYLLAGVSLLMTWLSDEESQAQALSTGLDRLLQPGRSTRTGKPAWPSRPG